MSKRGNFGNRIVSFMVSKTKRQGRALGVVKNCAKVHRHSTSYSPDLQPPDKATNLIEYATFAAAPTLEYEVSLYLRGYGRGCMQQRRISASTRQQTVSPSAGRRRRRSRQDYYGGHWQRRSQRRCHGLGPRRAVSMASKWNLVSAWSQSQSCVSA